MRMIRLAGRWADERLCLGRPDRAVRTNNGGRRRLLHLMLGLMPGPMLGRARDR